MQEKWLAEVTNDPSRDYELCIELSFEEKHWGTIAPTAAGEVMLTVFPTSEHVKVPAAWLADVLSRATEELSED